MTEDEQRRQLQRRKIAAAPYEVGYGKPPKATRFQPGRSGNPRGRPKGAKNRPPTLGDERMRGIILDEAYRMISVRDGARDVTVPMAQAIVRSTAVAAAKGNARAQKLFTEMLKDTEAANARSHQQWLEIVIDYKLGWEREIARCKARGLEVPEPVPHPDHIEIDLRRGTVRITGPMTDKEKEHWDLLHARKAEFEGDRRGLEDILASKDSEGVRDLIRRDIADCDRLIAILDNAIRFYTGGE